MRSSLLVIGSLALIACGRTSDPSSLKLTNGIAIDAKVYPAVVQLMTKAANQTRYCTGFFVNEYQVLTAAHCVGESTYLMNDKQKGARSLRAYTHQESTRGLPYDVAVLEFPSGYAKASIRLGRETPRLNDAITLVGYGQEQNTASSTPTEAGADPGTKRYGQNSIASMTEGVFHIIGVPRAKAGVQVGQFVATAQGDSGGPLLMGTAVVGMTVAGEIREGSGGQLSSVSHAVDLNSASSREFLESVLD